MPQGRFRCRFDFPKRASATTHLKRNRDIGNKARFYVLKREQGDEYINPYNPHILRAWGANMDLQMVGSVYCAAQYVCHYMCKDEPKEKAGGVCNKWSGIDTVMVFLFLSWFLIL